MKNVPFEIKRVYYIFNTEQGVSRGYHAHKTLKQILVCVSGSCNIKLDNGVNTEEIILNKPNQGLFIEGMIWREMHEFSRDCVLMVLANELYNEEDYIRSYQDFIEEGKKRKKGYFCHENSIVESTKIGEGTTIWAYAHVFPNAVIGDNCNINDHTLIENDVVIGNNVTVKSGVHIWNGARIGNNVFIGPSVVFTNDLNPRSKIYPEEFKKIIINDFASIGANSTLLGGISIGKYALIGAGSVVTKNVPEHALVYGNPAEIKGYVCKCGEKIIDGCICEKCGMTFSSIDIEGKRND